MNARNLINSRLLALACIIFLILVLTACDGGDGETQPEPAGDSCKSTSVLENGVCRTFAVRVDAQASTPFLENGQPVSLEIVLFQPMDGGRFPTVMFNHGSTGDGSDPTKFGLTFTSKTVARYFVARGWMVAFPQRNLLAGNPQPTAHSSELFIAPV